MGLPRGRYFFKTVLLVLLYWVGVKVKGAEFRGAIFPCKTKT